MSIVVGSACETIRQWVVVGGCNWRVAKERECKDYIGKREGRKKEIKKRQFGT